MTDNAIGRLGGPEPSTFNFSKAYFACVKVANYVSFKDHFDAKAGVGGQKV